MGTMKANDRSTLRVQTDNSVEAILRKDGVHSWLENCGPTSATTACDVTGHDVTVTLPGGVTIQGEDALAIWMNDPTNAPELAQYLAGVDPTQYLDNEIIQYYPDAIRRVFGATAYVLYDQSFAMIANLVQAGNAVMVHLNSPKHYLCVVDYDEATQSLVYRDPYPGRTGTDGFNLKMAQAEYDGNVQNSCVVVNP